MAVGGASSGITGGGGPNLASGSDFTNGVGNGAMSAGRRRSPGLPARSPSQRGRHDDRRASSNIESGRPDFQKNVVDVASKSPELIKLLQELRCREEALRSALSRDERIDRIKRAEVGSSNTIRKSACVSVLHTGAVAYRAAERALSIEVIVEGR